MIVFFKVFLVVMVLFQGFYTALGIGFYVVDNFDFHFVNVVMLYAFLAFMAGIMHLTVSIVVKS